MKVHCYQEGMPPMSCRANTFEYVCLTCDIKGFIEPQQHELRSGGPLSSRLRNALDIQLALASLTWW